MLSIWDIADHMLNPSQLRKGMILRWATDQEILDGWYTWIKETPDPYEYEKLIDANTVDIAGIDRDDYLTIKNLRDGYDDDGNPRVIASFEEIDFEAYLIPFGEDYHTYVLTLNELLFVVEV